MNHPISMDPANYAPGARQLHDENGPTLFGFVWKDKQNRKHFLTITFAATILFGLFKILYPEPDFFSDSYSYIFAASAGIDANIWPIGYSKFLAFVHLFTHSDVALIYVQFFLYLLTALYFYATLLLFYQPKKEKKWFIATVIFFNPLMLYLTNYVTSDILFCSLSLVWITSLLWMITRPGYLSLIINAVVLVLAFIVRYNAMVYPIIGTVVILFCHYRWLTKILAIVTPWVLIVLFIFHSRAEAKRITGIAQFPILSGWQWGNNALYIYDFVDVDNATMPTQETKELNLIAKQFFRETPFEERDLTHYVANYFIRQRKAPLKKYLDTHYQIHTGLGQVIAWGRVSPIYADFGLKVIKDNPWAFFKHYLLVNTRNYFIPPLEKLEVYNLGQKAAWQTAVEWFDWDSGELHPKLKPGFQGVLLMLFPSLFLVLNLYYLFLLGSMFVHIPIVRPHFGAATLLLIAFFILNFGFSVFANIIVIRYQVFPMLLFLCFCPIMVEEVVMQKSERKQPQKLAYTN